MAATGELKARIQLLQAAKARAEALGKGLKPEVQKELDSYREQGLLGANTGGASGSGAKPTEAQAKAVGFLTRALGANEQFEQAHVAPRGVVTQGLVNALPDSFANSLTSDARQVSENAQRDFVTATLRQESGAAISASEFDNQRKTFFPQPGDGEKVIAAKAEARRRALSGLISAAGNVVGDDLKQKYSAYFTGPGDKVDVRDAIAQAEKGGDQQSGTAGAVADGSGAPPSGPSGPPPGTELKFNDELPQQMQSVAELTAEQQAALQAVAQSGGSAEQIMAVGQRFGRNISAENAAALAKFYADPKNRSVAPILQDDRTVKPVDAGDGAAGAFARGAGNTLTLGLLDEAGALADTVTKGGTYSENLDQRRGQELFDEQNHSIARPLGQLAGAIPLGGVEIVAPRAAAQAAFREALASGATPVVARAAANRALASRAAINAAAQGGAYSFGDTDGGLGERLGGAAVGAGAAFALGGAAAYGGSRFSRMLAQRTRGAAAPVATDGQEVLAAMERQGVRPFAPDVGGATTRRAAGATAQTIGGVAPIRRAAQETLDTSQAVRDRVASAIAAPIGVEEAGETARAGAQRYIAGTGARIRRMYDQAQQAAGSAKVKAPAAYRLLETELAPLREAPVKGPGVSVLEGLRDALVYEPKLVERGSDDGWQKFAFVAPNGKEVPIEVMPSRSGGSIEVAINENGTDANAYGLSTLATAAKLLRQRFPKADYIEGHRVSGAGPGRGQLIDLSTLAERGSTEPVMRELTVQGLRSARSAIRDEFANNGLRGSNVERIANRVLDAANDDIVTGLREQGLNSAARQFRVADRMWKERLSTIDEHLEPILGDANGPRAKSGEQIVQSLTQAMAGNNKRFAGFMQALPDDEQKIVRSSLIARLGQAAAGQQDQTGEVFSLGAFLTHYNKIGARARNTLFGQEGRAALDDLARIASGAKEAQRFANFSNTGAAVTTSALGAATLAGPIGLATAAKALAGQYAVGRLIASPRFARWLARAPRQANPAANQQWLGRLDRIARAEPAIAADVLSLQQRLADTFGTAPTRLAADEGNQRGNVPNGQAGQQQPPAAELQP